MLSFCPFPPPARWGLLDFQQRCELHTASSGRCGMGLDPNKGNAGIDARWKARNAGEFQSVCHKECQIECQNMYVCHKSFQMVCHKLYQNCVEVGWGALEESNANIFWMFWFIWYYTWEFSSMSLLEPSEFKWAFCFWIRLWLLKPLDLQNWIAQIKGSLGMIHWGRVFSLLRGILSFESFMLCQDYQRSCPFADVWEKASGTSWNIHNLHVFWCFLFLYHFIHTSWVGSSTTCAGFLTPLHCSMNRCCYRNMY